MNVSLSSIVYHFAIMRLGMPFSFLMSDLKSEPCVDESKYFWGEYKPKRGLFFIEGEIPVDL